MEAYRSVKILDNSQLTSDMYEMVLELSDNPEPGQFYMLRDWNGVPYLPRPFSVSDSDGKSLSILYQEVGKGTEIMTGMKAGDSISVLGPLGKGYPLTEGRVALVGGGVGIAPLLYLARKLPGPVDVFLGFRDEVFFIDRFEPLSERVLVSTESGSSGHKGFVTGLLEDRYEAVYACGNMAMMKAVKDRIEGLLYLSLESHMACGIGACLGCVQKTSQGMKTVCKDGPVFESQEVLFDNY